MSTSSSATDDLRSWLNTELARLIAAHGVPGAAVGVLIDDETIDSAAGLLHLGTGVEADTDSLFQIGSITKVWTATLVMQLVDEGLLDLDTPIRAYLPEFHIADEDAAAAITARHLLSHRAGFEGDLFTDTGRGDDCVQKYVATLADTPQLFPPGERFSYNNAGYVVLGRLVEVLRGAHWERVLTEHLIEPLGLRHAAPGPYEAIMHRVAQGHVADPEGTLVPAPMWSLVRSNGPAGASLSMTARDLLAFARMHLANGQAADGRRVLSEESVGAMREIHAEVPDLGLLGNAWGLGWEIDETTAGRVVSHDGNTIGQSAFLRILPARGIAIALLTNGGDSMALYRELFGALFDRLTGAELLKPLPTPPDLEETLEETEAAYYVGTYSASILDMIVTRDDEGRLWVDEVPKGAFAELAQPQQRTRLVPYHDGSLITLEKRMGTHFVYAFVGVDGEPARFLHTGRAMPRHP
ncbi:serine hydrolase [Microbacterium sp. 18062]|uniref:serine hydrolase domain-containing protein n=1 Tax=Microbacterium sp. 18062 TaxID=2681410 RepID=UPI00135711A4|nr:serine hydrolase domain-containing protein [Microbacterium sp. 18062]